MHMIGITHVGLEKLHPRGTGTEEHGDRETELRLCEVLA